MSSTTLNIIILTVNIILWIFFFIKFKKTYSPDNILHSISEEVDKLLIEINKSTDNDLTLLEQSKKQLQDLIDEADKRIQLAISEEHKAELSQTGAKKINAATRTAVNAYQKAKPRPAQNTNAEELTYIPEEHVKKYQEQETGFDFTLEPEAAPALQMDQPDKTVNSSGKTVQTELPFELTVSDDFVKTEKTFQQKVIELWRQGLDTQFIADKLSVSYAEVQMIVDIYGA